MSLHPHGMADAAGLVVKRFAAARDASIHVCCHITSLRHIKINGVISPYKRRRFSQQTTPFIYLSQTRAGSFTGRRSSFHKGESGLSQAGALLFTRASQVFHRKDQALPRLPLPPSPVAFFSLRSSPVEPYVVDDCKRRCNSLNSTRHPPPRTTHRDSRDLPNRHKDLL